MIRAPRLARLARRASRGAGVPVRTVSVLMLGTDDVSLETLTRLNDSLRGRGPHAGLVTALGVVCPSDRPAGRGQVLTPVPVRAFCAEHAPDLPLWTVPYGLKDLNAWDGAVQLLAGPAGALSSACGSAGPGWDVGVVVSFGYFITPNVLAACRRGAMNMHPSALPRWRGAAPVAHTLLAGDAETAVSIIEIHPTRFDAGRLLHQERHPVRSEDDAVTLTARLAAAGGEAVMRVLANWDAAVAGAQPQAEAGATRAPKLQPAAGLVRCEAVTVAQLLRMRRAFEGGVGLHAFLQPGAKRVRLLALAPLPDSAGAALDAALSRPAAPGTLAWEPRAKRLALRVSDGWLELARLQAEGRAPVAGAEFANGLRLGKPPPGIVALRVPLALSAVPA